MIEQVEKEMRGEAGGAAQLIVNSEASLSPRRNENHRQGGYVRRLDATKSPFDNAVLTRDALSQFAAVALGGG